MNQSRAIVCARPSRARYTRSPWTVERRRRSSLKEATNRCDSIWRSRFVIDELQRTGDVHNGLGHPVGWRVIFREALGTGENDAATTATITTTMHLKSNSDSKSMALIGRARRWWQKWDFFPDQALPLRRQALSKRPPDPMSLDGKAKREKKTTMKRLRGSNTNQTDKRTNSLTFELSGERSPHLLIWPVFCVNSVLLFDYLLATGWLFGFVHGWLTSLSGFVSAVWLAADNQLMLTSSGR